GRAATRKGVLVAAPTITLLVTGRGSRLWPAGPSTWVAQLGCARESCTVPVDVRRVHPTANAHAVAAQQIPTLVRVRSAATPADRARRARYRGPSGPPPGTRKHRRSSSRRRPTPARRHRPLRPWRPPVRRTTSPARS